MNSIRRRLLVWTVESFDKPSPISTNVLNHTGELRGRICDRVSAWYEYCKWRSAIPYSWCWPGFWPVETALDVQVSSSISTDDAAEISKSVWWLEDCQCLAKSLLELLPFLVLTQKFIGQFLESICCNLIPDTIIGACGTPWINCTAFSVTFFLLPLVVE